MLASSSARLDEGYDVVIVGSGYGGAITAARLGVGNHRSGGRLRVALLERGDERPLGSFPESAPELAGELRHPLLRPLGLFEFLAHSTVDVIQGNGLGGTSLINANVAIEPDREVFAHDWPRAIAEEAERGLLEEYYRRARRQSLPDHLGVHRAGDRASPQKARPPALRPCGRGRRSRLTGVGVTLCSSRRTRAPRTAQRKRGSGWRGAGTAPAGSSCRRSAPLLRVSGSCPGRIARA